MDKKTLTIVIGCYNEEENVEPLVAKIREVTNEKMPNYRVEILFIDNDSQDHTRDKIRMICAKDKDVKAIFNVKNFGHIRSPYHALKQAQGDCVMLMCADFQDPPELIPEFVKKWEEGYKIVIGTKKASKTNPILHLIRRFYYKLIKKMSDVEQIENFTGFGLYDKSFVDVLRDLDDPYPYLRGIVAEFGGKRYEIPYVQPQRRAGRTKNNFGTLYDMAMTGFVSYSKALIRIPTFFGAILGALSFIGLCIYFVFFGIYFPQYPSLAYMVLCCCGFFAGLIIFFVGILGEYILQINIRVINRPLVAEEERINF